MGKKGAASGSVESVREGKALVYLCNTRVVRSYLTTTMEVILAASPLYRELRGILPPSLYAYSSKDRAPYQLLPETA